MENAKTNFVEEYEPDAQARAELKNGRILDSDPLEDFRLGGSRAATLFMDGKLVLNNCGLAVESNGRA